MTRTTKTFEELAKYGRIDSLRAHWDATFPCAIFRSCLTTNTWYYISQGHKLAFLHICQHKDSQKHTYKDPITNFFFLI